MPQPRTALKPAETVVDEVFLSPRVVDREAFNDFASALRTLIQNASAEGQSLRTIADQAQHVTDALQKAGIGHQSNLDLAARALATIEQRTQHAESLLERVTAAAAAFDHLQAQADELIEGRVRVFQQHLDKVQSRVEAMLTDLDAGMSRTRRDLESTIVPTLTSLGQMCAKAEALGARPVTDTPAAGAAPPYPTLANLIAYADRVRDDAASATCQLDAVRQQAEQARTALGESVAGSVELIDHVTELKEHLEISVSSAVTAARDAEKAIADHTGQAARALEASLAELKPRAAQATTDLRAVIGEAHDARRAVSQATVTGELAASHLVSLVERLEPWHDLLLTAEPAADLPKPLRDMVEAVRAELCRDLSTLAGALHTLAARTDQAIKAVDRPAAPAEAARKPASGPSA